MKRYKNQCDDEYYRVDEVQALCREVLPFISIAFANLNHDTPSVKALQSKLKAIIEATA